MYYTPLQKQIVYRYITRSPMNSLHAHYTPTVNSYIHMGVLGLSVWYELATGVCKCVGVCGGVLIGYE